MNANSLCRHHTTRVRQILQHAELLRYRWEYRRRIVALWKSGGPGVGVGITRRERDEIRAYWRQYGIPVNLEWYRLFKALNGNVDPRYVPEETFRTRIEPILCRRDVAPAYHDKNQLDRQFADLRRPLTVLRNIYGKYYDAEYRPISREDVPAHLADYLGRLFVKPSISGTGSGSNVALVHSCSRGLTVEGRRVEFSELESIYFQDFVVQGGVEQHASLSAFYPDSLNTLRVITLRVDGDVVPLAVTFRMGNGSHVDNGHAGGLLCGVNLETGALTSFACDVTFKRYSNHPLSHQSFEGQQMPSFAKVIDMALAVHQRLLYFDQVSCDIAVTPDAEPCLIEVNTFGQGVEPHQFLKGAPLFGEYTEHVLQLVSHRVKHGWNI